MEWEEFVKVVVVELNIHQFLHHLVVESRVVGVELEERSSDGEKLPLD
jgi:hypothetical protein